MRTFEMHRLYGPRALFLLVLLVGGASQTACAQAPSKAEPGTPPPTVFADPSLVQHYQNTISPDDLAAHLYLFASDLFEGREATTRGQKLAAHYLAAQYRKLGLKPGGTVETDDPYAPAAYFQPFKVYGHRLREARLTVMRDDETIASSRFSAEQQSGDAYLAYGNFPRVEGGVVFAGYGISDPELGYDDYAALKEQGLTPAGKWVLILGDEPMSTDSTSLLPTHDGGVSVWTRSIYQKRRAGNRAGEPRGYLVVNDLGPGANGSVQQQAERAARGLNGVGSLALEPNGTRTSSPIYMISSELANELLAATGRTVEALKAEIDRTLEPIAFPVPDVRVRSEIEHGVYEASTENVLAYVEGSDPVLKDEFVVISSHYDHVGIDPTLEGDQIMNGADDDGSGTVTTLEVAEAFATAARDGYRPRRSILFLNFTAEEKGLLGSEYYADAEPVFPIEQTVTNLNIDMIGRHDPSYQGPGPNYIYIIGSNLISQELHDINARVNDVTDTGLVLSERFNSKDDPNQFYARSDHWNFGKHGVPFIFFFNGTHEDYHGADDEPEKVDYERMADVARLVFGTAWQVANQENRPAVSGEGFN